MPIEVIAGVPKIVRMEVVAHGMILQLAVVVADVARSEDVVWRVARDVVYVPQAVVVNGVV